jgi:hypothetical protein
LKLKAKEQQLDSTSDGRGAEHNALKRKIAALEAEKADLLKSNEVHAGELNYRLSVAQKSLALMHYTIVSPFSACSPRSEAAESISRALHNRCT